jgi:uncharacterized membrane protein
MLELPASRTKRVALLGLSGFFMAAGANHFLNPDFYVGIMPAWLPAHRTLVWVSGGLEALGGLCVLIPSVRKAAGWGLVLLLLAIFPANVHMALHPELFPNVPSAGLYLRLPVQGLFMVWAFWATRPDGPSSPPSTGTP